MAENEWISVKDSLPSELEQCYVWIADEGLDIGYVFPDDGWASCFHGFHSAVEYWKPFAPIDQWINTDDCLPFYDGWYLCYFDTDENGIDDIMPTRFSVEKECFYSTFEDDPADGWKHDDVKKWIGWPSPPQHNEYEQNNMRFELHDAKKDVPVGNEGITFGFHRDGDSLEGRIAIYIPSNGGTWCAIGDMVKNEDGEDAYEFDDITDWVDYWAPAPDEMYTEDGLEARDERKRGRE